MICHYANSADVSHVLAPVEAGQEVDLDTVAVSYCHFGRSSYGWVDVGVKNTGNAASASARVHQKYGVISGEPDQSLHTYTVKGGFAFEVSTTTPLPSGPTLYAVNAQGSFGKWYVSIQYYAHQACSTSAMLHLLQTVLSKVPA